MTYSTDDVMEKAKDTICDAGNKASAMASQVRERAGQWTQSAQQGVQAIADSAAGYAKQGRQRAQAFEESMEEYVRERPISAVLLALGIGLLVGAVLTRR